MHPLKGIVVVALEQAVAAPFATRQLADLGARVIKIERPQGGDFARGYDTTVNGLSSYFVWLNRSKESLTLDLKHKDSGPILDSLLARADVFVQNLAPGAAIASARARSTCVRAIRGSSSATCQGTERPGRMRRRKRTTCSCRARSASSRSPALKNSPVKVGISIADIAAGMYGFSGILAALIARGRTGEGATVDVSLFDALAEWMSAPAYYTKYGGAAPARTGANHASIAPYGPFRSARRPRCVPRAFRTRASGIVSAATCSAGRSWRSTIVSRRTRGACAIATALHDEINAVFSDAHRRGDPPRGSSRAQIAYARMNSIEAFLDHPQLADRGRWRDIESPAGRLSALLPPTALDGVDPVMGAIPALGQHSDAILGELGLDRDAIARLRAQGVV